MTEPEEPEINPLLEALILAARDRDCVRACYLMVGVYEQDGTVQFAKAVMLALWRDQFPSDNGTGAGAITQRFARAIQALGHTIAVNRDGSTMILQDSAICAWLAARNGLIGALPSQINDLPLTNAAIAELAQLLDDRAGAGQQTMGGVGALEGSATVERAGAVDDTSGWVLTAEAEVVRDGQVVE